MTITKARFVGACVQGVILGFLVLVALVQMLDTIGSDLVFRYQGF